MAQPDRTARPDLYACEGCDAVFERDPASLGPQLVIAGPDEPGQRIIIAGTIFEADGATPAGDVILYFHHTDNEGYYADGNAAARDSSRHGRLQGWLKTGPDERYRVETIKPAPYPSMTMPAHVHIYVGEPGRRPYYIDDIVFAGEFKVDSAYIDAQELRGGSGIVTLQKRGGAWHGVRDIVLERHPD